MARVLQKMALMEAPVVDVMEPPFPVVSVEDTLDHLLRLLSGGSDAVLVREAGSFVAILTRSDVISGLSA